jgi:nitrate/nitrite-specific signal transduction histidine kinase
MLAASFNNMAAELADQRRHLEQRVTDRTRKLEALFDVTAVANASLDRDEVLHRSLARVVDVMNAHSGSVHLLEDDGQTLRLAAGYR